MTHASINTHAPLGAITILRLVDFVRGLRESVVARKQARQMRKILSRLSAEQLQDIGWTRSDLF